MGISKEQFIKSKMISFVDYISSNFDNQELITEIEKYRNIDIVYLLMWWKDNVKSVEDFILDIVERYNLTLTKEQHNKISKYLEVLNI